MARISFLTDYGTVDGFVAACHGVIAKIAPEARILDITHQVPPGDVRRGALLLAQTLPFLPPGVHIAVVDPGVGTRRRAVLVRTSEHLLVGPDNGLLVWAADAVGGAVSAHALTNRELMLPHVSATFHGRDVFAPIAAHLSIGTPAHLVGPRFEVDELVRLPEPVARVAEFTAYAEVLAVDRFGNVQTSLRPAHLTEIGTALGAALTVRTAHDAHTATFARTFGEVPRGTLAALVDSAGRVALAVNGGDAATELGLGPEDPLTLARTTAPEEYGAE
jgi:S-adenosylmethionine hydrolase